MIKIRGFDTLGLCHAGGWRYLRGSFASGVQGIGMSFKEAVPGVFVAASAAFFNFGFSM